MESLRQIALGPFSRLRPVLLDALDKAVSSNGEHRTVNTLIAHAVEDARKIVPATKDGKPFPWRKVEEFLRELMTRRPVLLADNREKPFPASFQELTTIVSQLTPDWRLDLEGELVLAIIRSGNKVHLSNLADLAGALYGDRSTDGKGKISTVIRHLLKSNRLVETTDNFLAEPNSPEEQPETRECA